VLLVPVAFTSDHIETLYEIGACTRMQTPTHPPQTQPALGMEYAEEAEEHGIEQFGFTQGLNGSDTFVKARAAWASSARRAIAPSYCCARVGKGTREHRARAPRRRRELLAAGAPPRITLYQIHEHVRCLYF
jgi:hypothetical protein